MFYKNRNLRKLISAFLCALFAFSLAQGRSAASEALSSDIIWGDNLHAQDYSLWADTVKSYLHAAPDGSLMRVQSGYMELKTETANSPVVIEYYDENYRLTEKKLLRTELPVFGGFYAADNAYYILSGQTNYAEDDRVEVFRLTKYDTNWNRLGAAGVFGANTYSPFDAGSARFAECGKYLLVRTAHEMYAYYGVHHQANVTLQFDTESMKLTDAFYEISNVAYGYVSHSFNQFIKVEDNKIAAADHGDANPRTMALILYDADCSDGSFRSRCNSYSFLDIAGVKGNNYTGASLGGFEISESSYLAAGNSVLQDGSSRSTRNIFVSAVNKETYKTELRWITSYEEGSASASTPHFVKIDKNRFILLWERDNSVYYTEINGNGEQTDSIHELNSAALSDCVPVIKNNELIWYVYSGSDPIFYTIELSDISQAGTHTSGILGDYDRDNVLSASDARMTLRIAVGLETDVSAADLTVIDVDFDGKITAADARLILRGAVGLEDPFSWRKEG